MHASHSSRQATPGRQSSAATSADSGAAPVVTITGGRVRGLTMPGGPGVYVFRGLPYAAPPIGDLRWRPPRPPAAWQGVRDATRFAPSPPQPLNPALTGPTSEDCLYLDVYTPTLGSNGDGGLPVLVWIYGGRFTLGAGRITTAPNWRRMASWSSPSISGRALLASSPTRRWRRSPAARPATRR